MDDEFDSQGRIDPAQWAQWNSQSQSQWASRMNSRLNSQAISRSESFEDFRGFDQFEEATQATQVTQAYSRDYARIMAEPGLRQQLLGYFLESQHVASLRPWQSEYVSRAFSRQTGVVLQLPPGAGKTLIAQWVILESLCFFPSKRVIFAVPLRVLAMQVCNDIQMVLDLLNSFIEGLGMQLPSHRGNQVRGFTVALAEGPGAVIDLNTANVVVATYEHAAGELRNDPRDVSPGEPQIHVGLVIIDEVHNIAKQDRGMVIDDIFFFTSLRRKLSSTFVTSSTHGAALDEADREYVMPQVIGMSGTLEDWVSKRLKEAYGDLIRSILTPEQLAPEPRNSAALNTMRALVARPGQESRETDPTSRDTSRDSAAPRDSTAQQQPRRGPPRIILPASKFTVAATADMALDIIRGLVTRRLENPRERPRRLVVFMSCVAEAEMAYIHVYRDTDLREKLAQLSQLRDTETLESGAQAEREHFAHPQIELVNNLQALQKKFGKEGFGFEEDLTPGRRDYRKKVREYAERLEAGGIYIHHAQITAPRATPNPGDPVPPSWSDVVQAQLSSDFVAVFSTSTISVGVNLASTQIGILGPNTMWTVDQAEQMIGRVGRVNEDAASSFVAVVDSTLYHAPMAVSISVPDSWFVPRFTAAVAFSRAWALRIADSQLHTRDREAENQEFFNRLRESLQSDQSNPASIGLEDFEASGTTEFNPGGSGIQVLLNENLDVRGFFMPANSAALHISDRPGNGIDRLARVWNIIDESVNITPEAEVALLFCKQDLKSLPAMSFMLSELFGVGKPRNPEAWRVVFMWSLLIARLPPKWSQWFPLSGKPDAPGLKVFNEIHALKQLPELLPRASGMSSVSEFGSTDANAAQLSGAAERMLKLYGESHVAYPGQPDIPGESNAENVRMLADVVAWSGALFSHRWPTENPLDLFGYLQEDVFNFLNTLRQTPIDQRFASLGLDVIAISESIQKAFNFVLVSLFPYLVQRNQLEQGMLNQARLPLGTNSAVGYLVPCSIEARDKLYEIVGLHRKAHLETLRGCWITMNYTDRAAFDGLSAELSAMQRQVNTANPANRANRPTAQGSPPEFSSFQ